MRNSSIYGNAAAFRGNTSMPGQYHAENGQGDLMPPMCGTKDCNIF